MKAQAKKACVPTDRRKALGRRRRYPWLTTVKVTDLAVFLAGSGTF
jgi:hypothetical protein